MTVVVVGSRLDVIEYARSKLNAIIRYDVSNTEWSSFDRDNPVVAYLNIKKLPDKASKFKHLIYENKEFDKTIQAWIKKHNCQLINIIRSVDSLEAYLIKLGFRKEAAQFVIQSCDVGLLELRETVRLIIACCDKPYSLTEIRELWPFVPKVGKVYSLKLGELIKSLGTNKSLELLDQVTDADCYDALRGLQVGCKANLTRVEHLILLESQIKSKELTPRAALVLFCMECIYQCQLKSTKTSNKLSFMETSYLPLSMNY